MTNSANRRNKIFNVATCKCPPDTRCECNKSKKSSKKRGRLLTDQRNERRMVIGAVDKSFSKNQEKSNMRKASIISYQERNQPGPSTSKAHELPVLDASSSNETSSITESGEDFSPNRYVTKSLKKGQGQNQKLTSMKSYPKTRKFA